MEKTFNIDGMSCGHCVMAVEKVLGKLEIDMKKVEIGTAKVRFDLEKVSEENIKNAIEVAGYKVIEIK
ncbi:MAG: cation transporter [Ignavibacteria bacterium]|nr:cation transporter [Ignavibacteria bacterium]